MLLVRLPSKGSAIKHIGSTKNDSSWATQLHACTRIKLSEKVGDVSSV